MSQNYLPSLISLSKISIDIFDSEIKKSIVAFGVYQTPTSKHSAKLLVQYQYRFFDALRNTDYQANVTDFFK